MIILEITFPDINISAQPGDMVYYVPTQGMGGFDISNSNPLVFGEIFEINAGTISVFYDDINNPNPPPGIGSFIMFAKDTSVNVTSLTDVQFKNSSSKKNELFAMSSDIFESSK